MKKFLRTSLATLAGIYIAACLLLTLGQGSMLYQPASRPADAAEAHLDGFERRFLTTADGQKLPYWEHDSDAPVILYFHGNGGGLYAFSPALHFLARHGYHVIAMEYRGYPGAPPGSSEKAIVGDAVTLFRTVHAASPKRPIVLWGYSLGSGVATEAAAQVQPAALVLEAPFSAAVDRAAELFPAFPVRLLMRDQFRSRDAIGDVHAPLFIMHGTDDTIIPLRLGEALYAKANPPKTFRRYPARRPLHADAGRRLRRRAGILEDLRLRRPLGAFFMESS
ncbi:MAG: alpha/beta fold hydrolase [Alphaproteobacteria bacterium]